MKYNRSDILGDRDSFRHFSFIRILAQSGFSNINSRPNEWDNLHELKEFEITVTIQGVEIDFLKFIDSIEKQYDERESDFERKVDEKAREIVLMKYKNTMNAIELVLDSMCKEEIESIQEDQRNFKL